MHICIAYYELAILLEKLNASFWRIGHFAWYFDYTMSQWVKLRGEFLDVKFGHIINYA